MERLRLQQGRKAAGPRGLRNSQDWDRPWRKKDLGTHRIEDLGRRSRFVPGLQGNGDYGWLCNADQLKKGCREGAQPSIRDPLRTWGCTDEDTRRCSDEGEH